MLKELFLVGALALPVASFRPGDGGHNSPTRAAFLKDYFWIMKLLVRTYPRNEFMFIWEKFHVRAPAGWIEVDFRWRGHIIYRRPLDGAA